MEEYKLMITGGKDFMDYLLLRRVADDLIAQKEEGHGIIIVSGADEGAAMLGERYAAEKGYEVAEFLATPAESDYQHYLREERMAKFADGCLLFWDNKCPRILEVINCLTIIGIHLVVIGY
jgi:hypothetical protein